ncbi:MAG: CHAP domain-containing protein [Magnetospirillum sp.]|nr:CHAP domain-containing protein [Magnetospirillum sp.]
MRKVLFLVFSVFALAVLPMAPASAIQCVPYAREVSGIHLKGDAWQWWDAAAGVYARGSAPRVGAVLVFSRQGRMSHGHVSVVTKVISNRMVLVDHANWAPARGNGRGKVSHAVPILDVSPHNDWSQVRVWYRPVGQYGNRVYRTEGFVYGSPGSRKPHGAIRMASLHGGGLPHAPLPRPLNAHGGDHLNAHGGDHLNAHGGDHLNARGGDHLNARGGDHLNGRPSMAGLVTVGNYAFHPRPRPTQVAAAIGSKPHHSRGI